MLAVGIIGFLPDFTPEGKLFGYFAVNPWHNVVHIATGFIAILCGLANGLAAKIFFILFGLAYAGIAVLGFMQGDGLLFNVLTINTADNWLHAGIALISLFFGLFIRSR
jgi:hypothetical protein